VNNGHGNSKWNGKASKAPFLFAGAVLTVIILVGNASLTHETHEPNHLIPSFPDKPIVYPCRSGGTVTPVSMHTASRSGAPSFGTLIDPSGGLLGLL
jgi:hypothetical protein